MIKLLVFGQIKDYKDEMNLISCVCVSILEYRAGTLRFESGNMNKSGVDWYAVFSDMLKLL